MWTSRPCAAQLDARAAADEQRVAEPAGELVPQVILAELAAPEQPPAVVPAVVVAPPAPMMRRRSVWEWLAVFMEERNVLWGEVVGGMLIVGCSIALVISLWQTLERVPLFPFLIFAALTSGLLGAGFYTLSHWKLESTSRGLLLIGMLMVPLNFLVLAGLSRNLDTGPIEIATAGAALAGFGWLTRRAGRTLVAAPLGAAGAGPTDCSWRRSLRRQSRIYWRRTCCSMRGRRL